jgi:hypothetical protein
VHAPIKGLRIPRARREKAFYVSLCFDRLRLAVALDAGSLFSLYSLSRSRFLAALPRRVRIHPTSRLHQGGALFTYLANRRRKQSQKTYSLVNQAESALEAQAPELEA